MGRCREAIFSYRLALQHKSDFFPSLQSLGHMYLLKGDYAQAAEYYGRLGKVEDAGARGRSRFYQACIPAHQGKFKAALQALDEGTTVDEREGITNSPYLSKLDLKSRVLAEMGDTEEALRVYRRLLERWEVISDESLCFWSEGYIRLLSAVDLTAAESYWKRIKNEMDSTGHYDERLEQACEGWLHLAEGNPQAAVICFEKACESAPVFRYRYALAAAYLQAGRAREAVEVLEKSLGACTENRVYYCIRDAKARYLLATAYEKIGDDRNTRKYYSEFANMWASADSETAELTVARRRLAHPEPDLHHVSKSHPSEKPQEK